MPAGDLVVADFQVELRATLHGAGTDIAIDRRRGGIVGLLDRTAKMAETEYAHSDGSFVGDVLRASRSATFNFRISGVSAAAAGALVEDLWTVWDPTGTAEEPLHFRLPGIGHRYVMGYPLGLLDVDTTEQVYGVVPFAALFRITDPTIYT